MLNDFIQHAEPHWTYYIQHDFVQQLAKGTLPEASFRHYLKQDYLYLFHYSRAFALAVFKGKFANCRFYLTACKGIKKRA